MNKPIKSGSIAGGGAGLVVLLMFLSAMGNIIFRSLGFEIENPILALFGGVVVDLLNQIIVFLSIMIPIVICLFIFEAVIEPLYKKHVLKVKS